MMGLLGELSLQVKDRGHRVPAPTLDQEGSEGEEGGSKGTLLVQLPSSSRDSALLGV